MSRSTHPPAADHAEQALRPSLFEIDLDAIAHNLREIQRAVGPAVKVFPVLKCNAYGFGLKEVGRIVDDSGVAGLAVGNVLEAIYLRKQGVAKPILVYANNLPSAAADIVRHRLMPTVQDLDAAAAYAAAARAEPIKVFVKIDVGLYRNGVPAEEAVDFCKKVGELDGLVLEGVYSHLNVTDPASTSDEYVRWQFGRLAALLRRLADERIEVPITMVAHSPIVSQHPDMYLNAVDPGKLVYGISFPDKPSQPLSLQPAFKSLRTKLIATKRVQTATPFGDRLGFELRPGMRIGILPFGWGDGLPRAWLASGATLVRGTRAPFLGDPSVEHTRIALTDVPAADVGDEVVLIGEQGGERIAPAEVARSAGIGMSELTRGIRDSVARLYYRGGRPYKLSTILGETLLDAD